MRIIHETIAGDDGTSAKFTGYVQDVFPSIDPARVYPAILLLPGGGYWETADREAEPVALKMLGYGFNVFVLRYSCAPSHYPTALLETAEAMQMIRTRAKEWHVDTHAVVLAGFSAGGHLAANLATCFDDPILAEHDYQPAQVRPDGLMLGYAVLSSGPYAHRDSFNNLLGPKANDQELLESLSMEKRVSKHTPPSFIWHTAADDAVPVQNSLLFAQALVDHHVPVEIHIFPEGRHGLSLGTEATAWADNQEGGIVPCVQVWPDLFADWVRRNFVH